MKVLSAGEMGLADRRSQELGIPEIALMERAGVGMARVILERCAPRRALVIAGGGNNGGDGFVVARELHRAGVEVSVLPVKEEYTGSPGTNLRILRNLGVRLIGPGELDAGLGTAEVVVDALLGTGVRGAPREPAAGLIGKMNAASAPVVALDVPSGVNAETGEVEGVAVRAGLTVAAHAVKLGCVISPGREHAGENVAVDIGVPPEADVKPAVEWTTAGTLRGLVPRLREPAHKYSAGTLLVVAGSRRMTGAAEMVVRGAQRAGCGIVFLATAGSAAQSLDARLTEALVSGVAEDRGGSMASGALEDILQLAERAAAVVVGPGIGLGQERRELVEGVLRGVEAPVLLDADAVTVLAGSEALARRTAPAVVTPHAGELGRLLGSGAREVSERRLASARRAAEEQGCCVLLKGSDTIVVEGERASVNSTGSVALATAGTGDVLSGIIGALASRGIEVYDAARAGAWAHGRAAEIWLERTGWPRESLVATDLLPHVPEALRELE
ncbi:NAD(P)H-hydrate dehydratase [Rubrobacter taiwanensis]|jgi:hydroxyethylthiazole kinase-like uncharacterized protein yjeF|uniref:Bifunctional NAD(P)H-hydrate repair enzyme n=1 Tax=Rubrobacter taiwanensis TaxID=185139 RepID=A0A4R1BDG9_9ACTN|nr:NAD(P)H-hydrate dehydratase [Rubrobacter taiwanensis]TCJ15120.1 NAD(P)H-hydrate dehydratase [Rubrobacter taiwanensis]